MARTHRRKRRLGRGIGLVVVLCLFVLSGIVRLGDIGLARASMIEAQTGHADSETAASEGCMPVASLSTALERVQGRAEILDGREAQLDERAAELTALEATLNERLATLQETETRLESLLALSDTAAESDLARLTQVYETMNAAEAAALFAQMDPSFAAGFLARMQPEAAAGILAELEPPVAYAMSVLLATRNASAPTASP